MNPKGKLVIIGGSVDRGSFSESETDLKRSLKFFEKGILKFPQYKTHSIHLTGSIAHYFSEEIRKIGKEMGIQIGEITQSPGTGLVEYHLSAADQLP